MNSKTRIRANSGSSSSAPLAPLSANNDPPEPQQPLSSKTHIRITTEHARKKLGSKIQALREQVGLTQQDLSKECGITITKLRMIEAGQDEPRLFTIISLAEALHTTAEDLFKEIK